LIVLGFVFWPRISELISPPAPVETAAPSGTTPSALEPTPSAQPATSTPAEGAAGEQKVPAPSGGEAASGAAPVNAAPGALGAKTAPDTARTRTAPLPTKPAPVIPKPVPKATLLVDCRHNFKAASLRIVAGTQVIYETVLDGKQKRMQAAVEVPAGERVFQVTVQSADPKFEDTKEVGGSFAEGMARTLTIEFGKGSRIGFTERKLNLRLGETTAAPAKPN
jgi:hypothetical protein